MKLISTTTPISSVTVVTEVNIQLAMQELFKDQSGSEVRITTNTKNKRPIPKK